MISKVSQDDEGGVALDAGWLSIAEATYLVVLFSSGHQALIPYIGSRAIFGPSQDSVVAHPLPSTGENHTFGQLSCLDTMISSTQGKDVYVRNIQDDKCKCRDSGFIFTQKIQGTKDSRTARIGLHTYISRREGSSLWC